MPAASSPWNPSVANAASPPSQTRTGVASSLTFFAKYFAGKFPVISTSTMSPRIMSVSGLTLMFNVSMAFSIDPSPAQPAKKRAVAMATIYAWVRSILIIGFVNYRYKIRINRPCISVHFRKQSPLPCWKTYVFECRCVCRNPWALISLNACGFHPSKWRTSLPCCCEPRQGVPG